MISNQTNNENTPIVLNRFAARGEVTALVSKGKVGKTLLTCYSISQNPSLGKVAYFAFDNGLGQKERFEQVPSISVIYPDEFDRTYAELRKRARVKYWDRSVHETVFKTQAQVEAKRKKKLKEAGLYERNKLDRIAVFEIYVKEAISHGIKLVVIDTLNALVGGPWNINEGNLRRITRLCRKNNISLLIQHHETKKGGYQGYSAFSEIIDTVLYLEKLDGFPDNILKITADTTRYLCECKSCLVERIKTGPHSARFEVREDLNTSAEFDLTPFMVKILNLLGDNETISFSFIMETLGLKNGNSLRNELLKLEKRGYLTRSDGFHWDLILNLHKQD